jgi:hypothetical protein
VPAPAHTARPEAPAARLPPASSGARP